MRNYSLKFFMISILSCSLLMWHMTAFATDAGSSITNSQITTDINGVMTKVEEQHFSKIKDPDMLASITMLAAGFVAGNMIKSYQKPLPNDVKIAAAGGVAFVAGEVMSNMKFKGVIDEMTIQVEKRSDGTINEDQIKRLEDLKKSYEEAKKTTKTKQMLQMAASAAFGIAALTAGHLAMSEAGLYGKCMTALNSSRAICTNIDLQVTAMETLRNKRDDIKNLSATQQAHMATVIATAQAPFTCIPYPQNVTVAAASIATANASINGSCQGAVKVMMRNHAYAPRPPVISKIDARLEKLFDNQSVVLQKPGKQEYFFDKILNFVFPKANASWLPLLGLGAGTLVAFISIGSSGAITTDRFMYVPRNRMIVFGGMTVTSYLAANSSANTLKKIDENLKKINLILEEIRILAKGVKASNIKEQGISIKTVPAIDPSNYMFSSDGKSLTPCLDGSTTGECKSIDDLKLVSGGAGLPESFKNISNEALNLGVGLSGSSGISGALLNSAGSLANKQQAIAKMLKKKQEQFNKIPEVNKTDFEKEQLSYLRKLGEGAQKELEKHGMSASSMMASLGTTTIDPLTKEADKSISKNPFLGFGNVAGTSAPEKIKEDKELDFKETPSAFVAGTETGSPKAELNITTNEIGRDDGPSIFEVISNRYLKSGYPRLLEEEKTAKQ